MTTGVYCVLNLVNEKVYIGSAAKSLAKRMVAHRYYLKRGTHSNEHLQNAWNKYGKDSFRFFILEGCQPEECLDKEQKWIDKFNACDRNNGYNKSPVAGSPLGYKHTDEARAKMSAATKGKKKSVEHAANIKAGCCQKIRERNCQRVSQKLGREEKKLLQKPINLNLFQLQ